MNLGIVVLEYAWAIREENIHWWDNLVIQYILCLAEIMTFFQHVCIYKPYFHKSWDTF